MRVLFLNFCLLFTGPFLLNDIYSIRITTLDGVNRSLSAFQNMKVLIVILPFPKNSGDSVFCKKIDSISKVYSQRLAVIAVPSFEDGFDTADVRGLQNYYNDLLGKQVTITEGMYTRKSSGAKQHELFSWLTHKEENIHFDLEVDGAKECFLVDQQGELNGIISPNAALTRKVINQMMQ